MEALAVHLLFKKKSTRYLGGQGCPCQWGLDEPPPPPYCPSINFYSPSRNGRKFAEAVKQKDPLLLLICGISCYFERSYFPKQGPNSACILELYLY